MYAKRELTLLPTQVVIQILAFAVMYGLVNHMFTVQTDNSLYSLAPGKVVVEVAVDVLVVQHQHKSLFEHRYRVYDDVTSRFIYTERNVCFSSEGHVGQEVHETFKDADVVLVTIAAFIIQRYILALVAAFEKLVAQFVTAVDIAKGDSEITA